MLTQQSRLQHIEEEDEEEEEEENLFYFRSNSQFYR
jgi:hypothetical protein